MAQDKALYTNLSFTVSGGCFDDAGRVSSNIKAILKQMGIAPDVVRRAALVAYESEINIVSYALRGMIHLRVSPSAIQIEAIDEGNGIPDIKQALVQGFSTATEKIREMGFGAGMGLNNIHRFSDVFHISSQLGKGTYLKMVIKTNEDGKG